MKQTLSLLSGLLVLALPTPALTQSPPPAPVNVIDQGRHMAALNDQTFGDGTYVVPPAPDGATQFAFTLKGYVFGLRLIKASYLGYESDRTYAAYTDMRTSGLGALLKKMDIWAVTRGRIAPDGAMRPDFHVQQNTDKKNRRVEMNYDNAARTIDVAIVPPLGSQGVPPASPEQRYGAFDTITTLLHMARRGRGDAADLCRGRVPVFDSKQHYNLRLEPVGDGRAKFLGDTQPAIHCHAFYEPVAGFDPEDLPDAEEAGTPVDVYFRYYPSADLHVPVRFSYKVSGFTAIIKMSELVLIAPDGTVVHEKA
ncbi:DUF3108 domain-containing protein [uncultured Algimonas sp.]|uniref:DUF3108 domain-containing protein n=1 Tax=uncultured Algimonas sp. TaxID=1547920 RepID=UPI002606E426|nr:DUF3108 domain-containing protein [uncultured Algimonas sp.]